MKLSSTILSLLPLAGSTLASCKSDGPKWYNPQPTWELIPSICNAAGVAGAFTRGQTKTRCINNGPNSGARFSVTYNGRDGLEDLGMDDANCVRLLEREVRGCAYSSGGKTTYDNGWTFEATQGGTC